MFMIVASSRHIWLKLSTIMSSAWCRAEAEEDVTASADGLRIAYTSSFERSCWTPAALTVPQKTRLTCYSAADFDAELASWGGWRSGWQLAGLDRLCVDGTLRYPLPLEADGKLTANVSRGDAASRPTHCDLRVAVA